jgi:hypothetical protein
MSSIITVLVILGFLGGVISLLMYVHKRDQKRQTNKVNP